MKLSVVALLALPCAVTAFVVPTSKPSTSSSSLDMVSRTLRRGSGTYSNSLGINGDRPDLREVNGDRVELPSMGSSSYPLTYSPRRTGALGRRESNYVQSHDARTRALERVASQTGQPYRRVDDVWYSMHKPPITVQGGGSLRTWSFGSTDRAQVMLRTEGRPFDAKVEVWAGPDYTPQNIRVFSEDGFRYPFQAAIATPLDGHGANTIAVRNTGSLEFPVVAGVDEDNVYDGLGSLTQPVRNQRIRPRIIQGGSIETFPVDPNVGRVQVFLESDGRPLNATIELLEGPNTRKMTVNIYGEDGLDRPMLAVMETPGTGSVIRIVNTGTVEFPIYAHVSPLAANYLSGGERGVSRGGYGESRYNSGYDNYDTYGPTRRGYVGRSRGGFSGNDLNYQNRREYGGYDQDYYNNDRYYNNGYNNGGSYYVNDYLSGGDEYDYSGLRYGNRNNRYRQGFGGYSYDE